MVLVTSPRQLKSPMCKFPETELVRSQCSPFEMEVIGVVEGGSDVGDGSMSPMLGWGGRESTIGGGSLTMPTTKSK